MTEMGILSLSENGRQILICCQNGLWLLDRVTGERRHILTSPVAGPPTGSSGMIYVGTGAGEPYATR